jgi:EmrB/QacA subfamily drug resistance transporter
MSSLDKHAKVRCMARKWQILLIVSIGAFMGSLDVFIVNFAFPAIQHDFSGTSLSALSWVLNGYAIVFAALLVPAGRIADRIGHRRAFMIGLFVFAAGSALCGFAVGPVMLVSARVFQAVGAALVTPTSLALILPVFPSNQRALAVGIWSAAAAVAAAIGPTVGGLLIQSSWRLVFFVNVPIGLICAIATLRVVPEVRDPNPGPRPDLAGAGLLALGIAALTLGIVQGSSWGWLDLRTVGALLAVIVLLATFVSRSTHHPSPVVDLSLLRVRSFVLACIGTMMSGAGLAAMLLSNVLFLTTQWGFSIIKAGLSITPAPAMAGIFAILGGRLASRVEPRRLSTIGAVAFGTGAAWWVVFMGQHPDYLLGMLPGMLLAGAGFGLTWTPLTTLAAAALPVERSATGLAVLNMARQIGTALGIAILVAILGTPAPRVSITIFQHGWLFIVAVAVLDGIAVRALRLSLPHSSGEVRRKDSPTADMRKNTAPIPIPVKMRR